MTPDFTDESELVVIDVPDLQVDLVEPVVLGVLLGPDGNEIATLLDRRVVPFGFQPRER